MSTRAKITVTYKDKELITKYYPIDGHIENWSNELVTLLRVIEPNKILQLRLFLNFFNSMNKYIEEDFLDYVCEIQILKETNEYNIIINRFKKVIFEGNLDEFEDKFC